jgi:TRAP-type C4-dicarboxylate transport system substrate-binding protein
MKACAATAEANGEKLSKEANDKALKDLAQHGMKVLDPSAELKASLLKIGETVTGEWKAKLGDAGNAIIAAYSK